MTQKCKIFIETQGDPTNPHNPKYPFYQLIERKPADVCSFGCKKHFSDKNELIWLIFGRLSTQIQLKTVQKFIFKLVTCENLFLLVYKFTLQVLKQYSYKLLKQNIKEKIKELKVGENLVRIKLIKLSLTLFF
jgi:hypothetical protein